MATQALAAMGQIPDEGKPYPASLEYARRRFLQDAMHQLRILFVAVKQEEVNRAKDD